MKTLTLFAALIALLACSRVEYENTLPNSGIELISFPEKLIGTYVGPDLKDTIIIGLTEYQVIGHDFEGKLSDSKTILKKFNEYYILNFIQGNETNWDLVAFKYKKRKIHLFYLDIEKFNPLGSEDEKIEDDNYQKEKIDKIQSITQVREVKDSINGDINYRINPTDEELMRLLKSDLYSKVGAFKKLK